ncbi:MAG: hypothetical protein EOO59_11405 [Hymenobacter sp.]|nr:MAG: hypothetical protein EOO59_11405 [Hymenobacter sp.]
MLPSKRAPMRHFLPRLLRPATAPLLLALLLAASAAWGQKTPTTEPHFAGGPDSLRALLGRVQQQASPALRGQLFLKLSLNKDGQPTKSTYLTPATVADRQLTRNKEAQAAAQSLLGQLPPWQLDPTASPDSKVATTVVLPLTFGPMAGPVPLLYSEQKPVFPLPTDERAPRDSSPYLVFLQRQFRYPPDDLRNRVQGTAYGYFEVSEAGAVEQRRVVGSLSPTIDAELLRVLQTLPNATAPPRHQGRPVRVAYLVPINLHIM